MSKSLDMAIALSLQSKQYEQKIDALTQKHKTKMQSMANATSILDSAFLKVSVGVGAAVAVYTQLNKVYTETATQNRALAAKFGITGNELNETATTVKQLTERGYDYNEVLDAATAYAKEFGLEAKTAFEDIKRLSDGGVLDTETLDQLKEYSTQAKAAGLSTEQFLQVITTSRQQGFFSDKLIDSIKEGLIRLREMPTATQKAIEKLDEQTKAEVKAALAGGKYFEAMQAISRAVATGKLEGKQYAEVVANIFGSPGEDVGQRGIAAIHTFKAELSGLTPIISELETSNNRLSDAWAALLVNTTTAGNGIGTAIARINNSIADFITKIDAVASGEKSFFDSFGNYLLSAASPIGAFATLFTNEDIKASDILAERAKKITIELEKQAIEAYKLINSGVKNININSELEKYAKAQINSLETQSRLAGGMNNELADQLLIYQRIVDAAKQKVNTEKSHTPSTSKRQEIYLPQIAPKTEIPILATPQAPQIDMTQFDKWAQIQKDKLLKLNNEIGAMSADLMANSVSFLTETITGALLGQNEGFAAIFGGFLNIVADFMKQFGEMMIKQAVATAAFVQMLKNPLAWPAALALGVGLVAASQMLKTISVEIQKTDPPALAAGGIAFGESLVKVGEYANAAANPEVIAPLSKLKGLMSDPKSQEVVFRIKGTALEGVLNNQQTKNKKF